MNKAKVGTGTILLMVLKNSRLSLRTFIISVLFFHSLTLSLALAEEVRVAVAANFLATFQVVGKNFEQKTGHKLLVSPGSSGKLYVQIQNGAPFDLFFSADSKRPEMLEGEGLAVSGSRFTYAVGRLTLWSADPLLMTSDGNTILKQGKFEYLAVANPKTAPYGLAAVQTLKALKLWEALQGKLVQGENIGQTFQFVFTQNAQLGFVALSQLLDPKLKNKGVRWDVPSYLYAPLTQQAVLLLRGKQNSAAKALVDYIKGNAARDIIERFGYRTE